MAEYATTACKGKSAFPDPALAEKAARRMRRKDKAVQAYRCLTCKKWHLGGKS